MPESTAARNVETGREVRHYADVSSRIVAFVIDAVVVGLVILGAAAVVSALIGPAVRFDLGAAGSVATVDRGVATVDAVMSAIVSAAYFAGTWALLGASPGLRALGMELGDERDGRRVQARRALVRWLVLFGPFAAAGIALAALPDVDGLLVYVPLLTWYVVLLVTTAADRERQGLHDRVARTVVAKSSRVVAWAETDARVS